jgi:hypothetical protein
MWKMELVQNTHAKPKTNEKMNSSFIGSSKVQHQEEI